MRFFSLYRVELRRLLLTKWIWLISALCLCTPLIGYLGYTYEMSFTMSALYIGAPISAGTTFGAVLWAVAAIFDANRQRRSGTDILAEATAPPVAHSAAKTAALFTVASIVTALCSLVYLPYTAVKLGYLFSAGFYFAHFLVFMLPTWWISTLFAESFYRITRRVELSALIYAALAYMLCFSRFTERKWLLWWLNPLVGAYSDGFPDIWFLRMGAYSRLMWLCAAAGLWTFSLMCQRKYQKGLFGSLAKSLKKVYLPIGAAFLVAAGTVLWNVQPFIGHGGEEFDLENEYRFPKLSEPIRDIELCIKVDPLLGTLSGRAEYLIVTPEKGESVFRLNAGYKVKSITYGGEPVSFRTVKEDINGQYDTYFELPQKNRQKLVVEYGGFPTVAQCMMPSVDISVGENYICLGNTDIAPKFANYAPAGGTRMGVEITMPDKLIPFINLESFDEYVENGDGTRTYRTQFGAEYIFEFAAGDYVTDNFSSAEGINFNFIYGNTYRSAVEDYDVRQSICDVYDYCTRHYGKSPFVIFGNAFKLFQKSSIDQGGFAVDGASVWAEDSITPNVLNDPNKGANAVDVFIHEMIHQWWGGVGMWCEDDGLWSAEGLTVYSTYRLVKEKYGELYAKQYYVDDWIKYVEEQDRNFYNRHPEYLDRLPENYREQISASNKGINNYKRMPLMILKAEELVGGEEKMDEILSKMYSDYNRKSKQYEVTYKEFLDYCGLTEEDLRLD